jgi:hypothetical protein
MQQVSLFVVCLLELLDIRFERSREMPNLKVQHQGVVYLQIGLNDAGAQLFQSIPKRVGLAHCWLAILVVMWISSLSAIIAYEWTSKTTAQALTLGKAFAIEQYQFTVSFSKELIKATVAYSQNVASQWQANQGSFASFRGLTRLSKPSLTFE